MEMLWPESDPDMQKRSFKVTLHRLRKNLEPAMDKAFGSTYVHIQDNRLVLDMERCWLDSLQFETLCRSAGKARQAGDSVLAKAHFREALALYVEDFMVHEPLEDWAETKRTYLRNLCIKVAFALGEMLEVQAAHGEALACLGKIIALDPLNEAAYCRMMKLHAIRGDADRVRAVYTDCCRALESQIDAAPSAKTLDVFETSIASTTHLN